MFADHALIAIEERAATWLVERDRGLSPARARELTSWLRADARHAAAYQALAETWQLMGEAYPATGDAAAAGRGLAGSRRRSGWPLTLAAAAAVAFMLSSLGEWPARLWLHPTGGAPFALTATTEIGVLRSVELPDGSRIQLNTDSAVQVRYTQFERRVKLTRGEAHFAVAKNTRRPFIVSAADVDVRVVGTVFNVRLRSAAVDVLVTEGKVRVASSPDLEPGPRPMLSLPASLPELSAGQKLSIELAARSTPRRAARADLSTAEIKQALAWQTRRLDFDSTPLHEIVAELNRYNRHQLVIADERLREQRFGGSFPAGDYPTFVRMLESSFGVAAEPHGDETWLRLKTP